MKTYHPELASGRWFTFSIAEQLGNVGSEYERALRAKGQGDEVRFEHALARLLELLDFSIADPRWRNQRLRELCRVREIVCDQLCSERPEPWSLPDLRDYFLNFGILARIEREQRMNAEALSAK
jgi:hypothetical protein